MALDRSRLMFWRPHLVYFPAVDKYGVRKYNVFGPEFLDIYDILERNTKYFWTARVQYSKYFMTDKETAEKALVNLNKHVAKIKAVRV